MSDDKTLGSFDFGGGEIGDVDLFGLDEFGNPAGSRELWGAVLGTGLSTGVAIAARTFGKTGGKLARHSELVGMTVGVAAAGAMMAMPATRAAGWTCLATSVVGNGLRVLEQMFAKSAVKVAASTAASASAATNGAWGGVVPESVQQFGAIVPEMINGFGQVVPEQIAGAQFSDAPPIDILSEGSLPEASQHVSLLGGPAMSGLGMHYGSTLFGGN